MNLLIFIYVLSLGLAIFAFLGFPILMGFVAKYSKPKKYADEYFPEITIVVAAHNEEKNLSATIESLLAQDYPTEKLEIVVFSDGSTDQTEQRVRAYAEQGVRLVSFEKNLGKTECQNRVVKTITTECVAFADGNVRWEAQALRRLIAPMKDPRISGTTGRLVLQNNEQEEQTNEGLFRKLDHQIKKGESVLFATIGVTGPIYAVRTKEFILLQPDLVSDLVLPVLLAAQGKRVVYVENAIANEPSSKDVWIEFKRKRRMITQGIVAIPTLLSSLSPSRQPLLFALLFSHKLLRWFGVELLLIALAASLLLLPNPLFVWIVILEILALFFAGLGLLLNKLGKPAGPVQPLSYFVLTNLASLMAKLDYMRGERAVTWKTQRS